MVVLILVYTLASVPLLDLARHARGSAEDPAEITLIFLLAYSLLVPIFQIRYGALACQIDHVANPLRLGLVRTMQTLFTPMADMLTLMLAFSQWLWRCGYYLLHSLVTCLPCTMMILERMRH